MKRLAFVISHPIQYFVPLYRRLAQRPDIAVKVFFTWHDGGQAVEDPGFAQAIKWDIPLTAGYDFDLVPNTASRPGTHSFFGLRNPTLVERVLAWHPDAVHLTGWAWQSHLNSIFAFSRRNIPILFRGDSHLLDGRGRIRWPVKRTLLRIVYSRPAAFLTVGKANRSYYQAFGVPDERLWMCPYCIDVGHFASPSRKLERSALEWRRELGLSDESVVVLFAGKFERKKRPLEFMRAVKQLKQGGLKAVLVGAGELERDVRSFAASDPTRFRVLPFQNQSRMPLVYRLGDLFVLPSAFGETWGLAVNEAMASGRAVLTSDRVGCAADLVDASSGRVFKSSCDSSMNEALAELCSDKMRLRKLGRSAQLRARSFDVPETEASLVDCLNRVCT